MNTSQSTHHTSLLHSLHWVFSELPEVHDRMETFNKLFATVTTKLAQRDAADNLSSQFKFLFTNKERIAFILGTDVVNEVIDKWQYRDGPNANKSSILSEDLRLQGNKLFKKRNFSAALAKYTESVFNAEYAFENSPCLSMALANRSAVLFQTNSFSDALRDAEMAICYGYPDKLMYKLLERIGKCNLKLNKFGIAKKRFRDAFLALSKSELTVDSKNELAFEYCKLENMCSNPTEGKSKGESSRISRHDPEAEKSDCNSVYPCATTAFSIISNIQFGRHAIATRNINAGELIIFEQAYSSVLFAENRLSHCHHCFKRCQTLIGCFSCNSVGFCSDACRNLALQKYHSTECQFINCLYAADCGFGHLALRMIITAGFKYLMEFEMKKADGLNDAGIYESLSYSSVYSLIGHSEIRSLSDLFRRSVLAVFLLRFLEKCNFFSSALPEVSMFDKKVVIGSHILKQLQMLPCNAHEVSELQIDSSSIADSQLKEIGSAIYATLSLLNHSCDPSVVRYSYGSSCALRAIKKIPKGEMIIDNYGALYAVTKINERQDLVSSQYYFNCCCEACENNWPLYPKLSNNSPEFICSKCQNSITSSNTSSKLHCKSCKVDLAVSPFEFEESRRRFTTAMNAVLDGGDPKEHLPKLLSHLQVICEIVKLPWQELNNCQEIVKQCFGMLGNHHYF